jgi:hypothetical protein
LLGLRAYHAAAARGWLMATRPIRCQACGTEDIVVAGVFPVKCKNPTCTSPTWWQIDWAKELRDEPDDPMFSVEDRRFLAVHRIAAK